jgi:translation elongation factor EF-4
MGPTKYYKFSIGIYLCFSNTNGVIIVYDVTNRDSFAAIDVWLKFLAEQNICDENLPIMLIGNKIDLVRTITEEEGRNLAKHCNIHYSEVSAKTNEGVQEAFRSLVTLVMYTYEIFSKIIDSYFNFLFQMIVDQQKLKGGDFHIRNPFEEEFQIKQDNVTSVTSNVNPFENATQFRGDTNRIVYCTDYSSSWTLGCYLCFYWVCCCNWRKLMSSKF